MRRILEIGLDDSDALLDQGSGRREASANGDLGAGSGPVPLEPGCRKFTGRHPASHDDLEGPLAEGDWRRLGRSQGQIISKKAVSEVRVPVQFFL